MCRRKALETTGKLQQGNVMNIKRNDALACSERQIVLEDP